MRFIILLLLIIIYPVSVSAADNLQIPFLESHPIIDGIADETYGPEEEIAEIDFGFMPPDDFYDLSSYLRAGWIEDSIYLFIEIMDNIFDTDDLSITYNNDGIELYFDGDNSKTESNFDGINDLSIRIEGNDEGSSNIDYVGPYPFEKASVRYKILLKDEEDGYVIEAAFNTMAMGMVEDDNGYFGFDVQINDADGDSRESIIRWHSDNDHTWHWAHLFGNATLVRPGNLPPKLKIYPDTLKFGEVPIHSTKSLTLTGLNAGSEELVIFDVFPGNNNYKVISDCETINPFKMGQFTVSFTPSFSGVNTTLLTFNSNDPDTRFYDIVLTGIGTGSSGIDDFSTATIPDSYLLFQNYPNPFNPVTRIRYGLPKAGHVEITLYNILGQYVTTLVDETKNAGYHWIDFNASHFAAGIYICKIRTGTINRTNKLILVK
jgi:hypothetical protein